MLTIAKADTQYPACLHDISSPPEVLYCECEGKLEELLKRPRVAIVGSRSVSPYGKRVTTELAEKLAGLGIVIISGLALGVDGLAHRATLAAGGLAIAVLPTPLDKIGPYSNRNLAKSILAQGGALLSEYPPGTIPYKQNFVARNRIVAGLAQVLLITEASEKSGSLHTARFALEQGKDVLAVPGNITSVMSAGTNNLLKAGATPVTSYKDVLQALELQDHSVPLTAVRGGNAQEQSVLDLMLTGKTDGNELLSLSKLSVSDFNRVLTMLQIGGKIRSLGANQWAIA